MRLSFVALALTSLLLGASASPVSEAATTTLHFGPGPVTPPAPKCPAYCVECEGGHELCGCELNYARCKPKEVGPICIQICITCKDGTTFCACDALNHRCID
ncbi:hypothetical protein AURDEDRAFT_116605 [Auricularia subglabra TFB-10046 SS5]|nr:hypothetical protein AURDEDRAFT_116605 [Auricularia subglabra TFB-10046 SS5]